MSKAELRRQFLSIRKKLPQYRREMAACALKAQVLPLLDGCVLSFSSFGSEIDTRFINETLASERRLVLPRVRGDELQLFAVEDCDSQLEPSSWGIKEPIPERCTEVSHSEVDTVLVPGLVFDPEGYRLGYGKGLIDRLLARLNANTVGVGFTEQFSREILPREMHDVAVRRVCLV